MIYDLIYKVNGVHVEDEEGKIIGHVYNDDSHFLRNFASKFGVDLNNLVPFIPGQKALWNFLENRFFKLTLLNKTIASKTIQFALGKKIKAAALKAVGAAMDLSESAILTIISQNNLNLTQEEENELTKIVDLKTENTKDVIELEGKPVFVNASSEELSLLQKSIEHYVSLFKINFNDSIEKITGSVASNAAALLAEKALDFAEKVTQTTAGIGATLLNPTYGMLALVGLKADAEFNASDTYSRSFVRWAVDFEKRKEMLGNRSSATAIQLLSSILPTSLQATSEDYENAYGKEVETIEGDWLIVSRDSSTIVSMSKVVEDIQASFGNIALSFGQSVKNLFGKAVELLETASETGKEIVSDVVEIARDLVEELPEFGPNIYDAEPADHEEVKPDLLDKLSSWWYGSK